MQFPLTRNIIGCVTPFCVLLFCATIAWTSPEIPGKPQSQSTAIVGATIHPISGPPVKATLIFENGKIKAIGKRPAPSTKVIDAQGKHVYPGMLNADGLTGLIEINSVRATDDTAEVGSINPNVKVQVAVNPDSELIPVTRANGVLFTLTVPARGLIAGTSAVLQLDGWTWEDMTLDAPTGMHIHWPRMQPQKAWWNKETAEEQNKERDEQLEQLQEAFESARAYRKSREVDTNEAPNNQAIDLRWEAMLPVLKRETPIIVHADTLQQIQAAVAFADQQNVNLIIYGGYDAPLCAALLKHHDVPVIISGIYRMPKRRSDAYDAAYTLPMRLSKLGVKFCITGAARFDASNIRNLPYHAATAAAYGLSTDDALKAITLYPAEILGVDDRIGSLEEGKDASLIITDGDILETATQVESAFLQGRPIDLSNRHKRLWNKYREKYRRLGLDGPASKTD